MTPARPQPGGRLFLFRARRVEGLGRRVMVVIRTLSHMTDDERRILQFERDHPENNRTKEAAIRVAFGFSWVRYRQLLLRLIGDAAAVEEFPAVVRRVAGQTAHQMAARRDRRFA